MTSPARSIRNISPKNNHWYGRSPTTPDCRRRATREVGARALALVQAVRSARGAGGALDAFLREYSLASREGVILMCLAEALLRIPDGETADRLIADKIPARRLGRASGRLRIDARECIDLGTDAHRPRGRARPQRAWARRAPGMRAWWASSANRWCAPRSTGDAHPRAPVRHGSRHRKRARRAPPARTSATIAIPSTCWARRR